MNSVEALAPNDPVAARANAVLNARTSRGFEVEASEIRQLQEGIVRSARTTLESAVRIGKLLRSVKERLPHGSFGKWVQDRTGLSRATACRYMRVAGSPRFANPKSVTATLSAACAVLADEHAAARGEPSRITKAPSPPPDASRTLHAVCRLLARLSTLLLDESKRHPAHALVVEISEILVRDGNDYVAFAFEELFGRVFAKRGGGQ